MLVEIALILLKKEDQKKVSASFYFQRKTLTKTEKREKKLDDYSETYNQ
jgi:hypothetical protein